MRKYVLNISDVKNWNQLRLVLANTFLIDYDKLEEPDDFWEPMRESLTGDTEITVYGLGKMAEHMPREASNLRTTFQSIDEACGLLDVYYEQSQP